MEKSLNEREEDRVTDSGLVASLKFFDDYNHREISCETSWVKPGSELLSVYKVSRFQMSLRAQLICGFF